MTIHDMSPSQLDTRQMLYEGLEREDEANLGIFLKRKMKPRKRKRLPQGHTVSWW